MFKRIVGLGFNSKGKNAKDVHEYISSLVEAGAEEFFTGYNPPYWHEKFGYEVSPNGRFAEHEQITDIETLKKVVEEVHSYGFEIFLNVNAWYYTDETFPYIKQMIDEVAPLGFDGMTCGSIGIFEYLKEIGYKGKKNLSCITAVYNSEAIEFFVENYTITKVILSREVTLKEIEDLASKFPNLEFEAFGEGDFCRYNNGLCFAEHKYGAKDICTEILNKMVIKKKFKPNYKEIILDESLSNEEKVRLFDDEYFSPSQEIDNLIEKIELGFDDSKANLESLKKVILSVADNENLFYDAMKNIYDKQNELVVKTLKGLKFLEKNNYLNNQDLMDLKEELEKSVKSGLEYFSKMIAETGGEPKVKAKELASLYGKNDNLNMYSYLFFSKIPNITTIKFPTRGRLKTNKLNIIKETLKNGKPSENLIDRGLSPRRAHYDLTYIFGDKLRFRKMIEKMK